MEKKNTILLTVIAIATLLVAVVGATFAYFTATVTTENGDNNATTVTTQALASAVMNMGDTVAGGENVYPGFKAVKSVTVTGACPDGNTTCKDVDATIVVTPSIPAEFGSDVTWTLYKATTPITCTGSNNIVNGANGEVQHSANYTCNTTGATTVISGSTTELTTDVTVSSTTNDTYYLVVEYANNETADQNNQQGKEFSVTLDFVPSTK